jgi:tetratricopeptide (TPR) repeat protein
MKRALLLALIVLLSSPTFAGGEDSACKKFEKLTYVFAELNGFAGANKYIDSMGNCQNSPSVILSNANALYKEGKYAAALAEYERYINHAEPTNKQKAPVYNYAGICANKLSQNTAAITYYLMAEKLGFNPTLTQYNIGLAYSDVGEYTKAKIHYQNSLQSDNTYANSWNNLGYVYEKTNDLTAALNYYAAAYKLSNGNDPLLMLNYGKALRQVKKYDSALLVSKATVAKHPNYYQAHTELAKMYNFYTKDVQKALYHSRLAVALAPNYSYAYFELAFANSSAGYKDSALYYYAVTLKLNPTEYVAYTNSSTIYKLYGYFDKAIEYNLKALEIKPNYSYAYRNISQAYSEKRDFENSLKYNLLNYKYGDDRPETALGVGYAYLNYGDYHKAIQYLHEAMIGRVEHIDVPYNNIGLAYIRLSNLDSAKYYLDIAYSINQKNSYNIHNRALYYYKVGNYDSACFNLEQALDLEYNWIIDPLLEKMTAEHCNGLNLNRKINLYGYKGHFPEYADKSFIERIDSLSLSIATTPLNTVANAIKIPETRIDEKPMQTSMFRVYPNPAQGSLTITHTYNATTGFVFDLYNTSGIKVYTNFLPEKTTQLNISALPKGLYVAVVMENNDVVHTEKVILE